MKAKIAEAYNEMLAKELEKEALPIIQALIKKAKHGDIQAIKELHDRLMGKAEQPLTGKAGGAIEIAWLNSLQSPTIHADGQNSSTTA